MRRIKFLQWLLVWMGIVFFQALLTGVHDDEAYYWIFSRHLDWGFFDHPPAVAFFIYLSDIFFDGILSIRFFTILIHLATLLALWKLAREITDMHVNEFWLVVLSLPMIHIYSFITTADAFLLFAEVLFFIAYRQVLRRGRLADFLVWGVTMAFLMYTKYHGILVILLTLASNFRLLLNPRFYAGGFLALSLYMPHLCWQFDHDFVSIRYHLFDRHSAFQVKYPFEFFLNVFLVFNPLLIGFLFRLIRKRPKTQFDTSLYVVLVGTLSFFLLNAFRTHVQPQWLLVCYVPFILLGFGGPGLDRQKYLRSAFIISLPIFIFIHIVMIFRILPKSFDIHGKEAYFNQVDSISAITHRPPVFYNSYRRAAYFGFQHNNAKVHSLNAADSRKNQFSLLWNDTVYHRQKVLFVGNGRTKYPIKGEFDFNAVLDTFYCYEKLGIELKALQMKGDTALVEFDISNPYPFDLSYRPGQFQLAAYVKKDKKWGKKAYLIHPQKGLFIPAHGKSEFRDMWFLLPDILEPEEFGLAPRVVPFPFSTIWKEYQWLPGN